MKISGTIVKEFGKYKIGGAITGPADLLKELEIEGYVELNLDSSISEETEIVTTSKRGRKPNK